jgi:hypothetical protein
MKTPIGKDGDFFWIHFAVLLKKYSIESNGDHSIQPK